MTRNAATPNSSRQRSCCSPDRSARTLVSPPGSSSDESSTDTIELTSSDAVIWPEVELSDGSWVAFDPVPAEESVDPAPPEPEPQVQTPAAPQPPIAPPPESDRRRPTTTTPSRSDTDALSTATLWATRVVVVGGVIVLPLLVVVGLVLGIKIRRRRRRRRDPDPTRADPGSMGVGDRRTRRRGTLRFRHRSPTTRSPDAATRSLPRRIANSTGWPCSTVRPPMAHRTGRISSHRTRSSASTPSTPRSRSRRVVGNGPGGGSACDRCASSTRSPVTA